MFLPVRGCAGLAQCDRGAKPFRSARAILRCLLRSAELEAGAVRGVGPVPHASVRYFFGISCHCDCSPEESFRVVSAWILSMVRVTWSSLRVASSIEPLGKCAKSGGNPGVRDRSGCSFQSEVVPDWRSVTEVRSHSGQPAQFEVRTPYRTGGRGRSRCWPRSERLRKILLWDIVSL